MYSTDQRLVMPNAWEALETLMNEWEKYLEQEKATGLLLELDDELMTNVSRNIGQLYEDWNFIRYYRVDRANHWDPIIQNVYNLNKLTEQLRWDMRDMRKKVPHELLRLLIDYRKRTDEILNPQTGEALGRFIEGRFKYDFTASLVSFHCHGSGVWYLEGIKSNHVNVDALINKLERIHLYFFKGIRILFKWNGEPYDLLTFMAAVHEKIAIHSFDVWINRHNVEMVTDKAARLVELGHKIDPVNPEFMNLLLSFLVDVHAEHSRGLHVEIFCDYLLTDSLKCLTEYIAFREELRSLVGIYAATRLQPGYSSLEEFSCLFAQTDSVLRDTSILYLSVAEKNTSTLRNQLECKVHLLRIELFIRDQLRSHDTSSTRMGELRTFVEGLRTSRASEKDKQYVILTEEIHGMLEALVVVLQSTTETRIGVDNLLQQVLFKIIFFKAEVSLFRILNKIHSHEMDLAPIKEDQISSLLDELTDFKRLMATELIRTLPKLCFSIAELGKMIEVLPDDFMEISLALAQLSHKVKCVKAMLQQISAPSALYVPKICSPGFIMFLSRNIKDLLKYDPHSIAPMKYQLEKVQQQLESLGSLLSDFEVENVDLNDHITQTAHKLEYVVESIEFASDSKYLFWLYNLVEDIKTINQQVTKISNGVTAGTPPKVSKEVSSRNTISEHNEVMVDLVDEEEAIINQLVRGSKKRDVVSVVGMPGIGKTTLARRVYNSRRIMYHFHRLAWCTISQPYSERELLLEILSGIHGATDEIQKMTDNDLLAKVRQCLKRRIYLIILDDAWDIKAWNYLKICFPDDNNGSRILITSRRQDLHSEIKPGSHPHLMRLFVVEESWMLLEKKIFGGVCYPEEMVLIGKKIAQQCQGLPLSIVAIAGLLQKTKMTRDSWEKISESLYTRVINDPENQCKEVLELSYKHLPCDLKACFLYLGAFLADKDILMSKLIQLWIAEGFIRETEYKSLEEVARGYLMELINRSLVMISRKGSYRKVKACRLHDLLRDLFRSKAKDDNFLDFVTINDEPYASFPAYEYDMEFLNKHKLNPVTFESYRLSIYLRRNHFFDSRPYGPMIRSLIFFAYVDKEHSGRPYDISFICENFRFLRVLDLECINVGVSFPNEIGLMVQLRYLALSGYLGSIPSSIAHLWKLQFLMVKGLRGTVSLPVTIWSMKNLRYLHVNEHVSLKLKGHVEQVECLDAMVSFSTPSLSLDDNTIDILRRFPKLLKLRCIFLESSHASKSGTQFPMLEFLTRLESLKIIYYGGVIKSGEFMLPLSLKKLTLSGFRLPWHHVSRIGMLPNLKVLKLLSKAFEGPRWKMNEPEFKALELLILEDLSFVEWDANSDHLPNLVQLVLRYCEGLEKIPLGFASINTLEIIQVQWCNNSVEESAKSIGDTEEAIKVDISYN